MNAIPQTLTIHEPPRAQAPKRKRKGSPPAPLTEAEMAAGVPCPLCEYYGNTPNAETIAAIEEGEAMLRGEIPGKLYDSVEELLRDLRS